MIQLLFSSPDKKENTKEYSEDISNEIASKLTTE
jgi:hypothetical protein